MSETVLDLGSTSLISQKKYYNQQGHYSSEHEGLIDENQ